MRREEQEEEGEGEGGEEDFLLLRDLLLLPSGARETKLRRSGTGELRKNNNKTIYCGLRTRGDGGTEKEKEKRRRRRRG